MATQYTSPGAPKVSRPAAAFRSVAQPLQAATNTLGSRKRQREVGPEKKSVPSAARVVPSDLQRPSGASAMSHLRQAPGMRAAPPIVTAPPVVAPAPPVEQPAARPQTRLEREKKRHYNDPPNVGPWKLGKLIGQGASGRVRHAVHSRTHQPAAVKIIPKQMLINSRMSLRDLSAKQDKLTLGIEREIVIMKLIEHPNLLGLWDVYETSKELFLVMEYVAGGELFDYLVARGRLRPHEARSYFRQIIFGVDYCHTFSICHRDLKPENLLLDGSRSVVKIADFGMAALQPMEKMLETSCGSPHYASPEIVSGKSYDGTASDIWSCGIILFALLCGRLPFDDPNIQTLLSKVRSGKFAMPMHLEPGAQDLIWRMLQVDPHQRATMREICSHPWFTDNGRLSSQNPITTEISALSNDPVHLADIDPDILGNLSTLWPELSHEQIIRYLLEPGQNWQKTFYSLLVIHRENHGTDDEDEDEELDEDDHRELEKARAEPPVQAPAVQPAAQAPAIPSSKQAPAAPSLIQAPVAQPAMQAPAVQLSSAPAPAVAAAPAAPAAASPPNANMLGLATHRAPSAERLNEVAPAPVHAPVGEPAAAKLTSTPPSAKTPRTSRPPLDASQSNDTTVASLSRSSIQEASPPTPPKDPPSMRASASSATEAPCVAPVAPLPSQAPPQWLKDKVANVDAMHKGRTSSGSRTASAASTDSASVRTSSDHHAHGRLSMDRFLHSRASTDRLVHERPPSRHMDRPASREGQRFSHLLHSLPFTRRPSLSFRSSQRDERVPSLSHGSAESSAVRPESPGGLRVERKPVQVRPEVQAVVGSVGAAERREAARAVAVSVPDASVSAPKPVPVASVPAPTMAPAASAPAAKPAPASALAPSAPISKPLAAPEASASKPLTTPAVSAPTSKPLAAPEASASKPLTAPAVSAPTSKPLAAPEASASKPLTVPTSQPFPKPIAAPTAPATSPRVAAMERSAPHASPPLPTPPTMAGAAAPLSWTQRLPSEARAPSSSHASRVSSGQDESLMRKFMREIADELDSLDAIGGSLAVASWPTSATPDKRADTSLASSSTADESRPAAWKEPARPVVPAAPADACDSKRASMLDRHAVPDTHVPRAPPAAHRMASQPSSPSLDRFVDADEDSLMVTGVEPSNATQTQSRVGTPVYAAFARQPSVHRTAATRASAPPVARPTRQPTGARVMPESGTSVGAAAAATLPPSFVPSGRPSSALGSHNGVPGGRPSSPVGMAPRPGSAMAGRVAPAGSRDPLRPASAAAPSATTLPLRPGSAMGAPRSGVALPTRPGSALDGSIGRPASLGAARPAASAGLKRPSSPSGLVRPSSPAYNGPRPTSPVAAAKFESALNSLPPRAASPVGKARPASSLGTPAARPASSFGTPVARPASSLGVPPARPASSLDTAPSSPAAQGRRMPSSSASPRTPLAPRDNRTVSNGSRGSLKPRRSLLGVLRNDEVPKGLGLDVVGIDENVRMPVSPISGEHVGTRHSWFNGLLHRRQLHVFMSVKNLTATVEYCQQLLQRLGATPAPSSRAHMTLPLTQQGAIVYLLEHLYDHAEGTDTICKPMRFRVEYTILPVRSVSRVTPTRAAPPPPAATGADGSAAGMPGYDPRAALRAASPVPASPGGNRAPQFATSVTFTHEKGSLTTFRMFMGKLRREWQLDATAA